MFFFKSIWVNPNFEYLHVYVLIFFTLWFLCRWVVENIWTWCPNLRKLAIKFLSQIASSVGVWAELKCFWMQPHKKEKYIGAWKNRWSCICALQSPIEEQVVNFFYLRVAIILMVYNVHDVILFNYRLYNKKRPYDPIDIDCIEKIDFWVVEDDPQSDLDYDELQEILQNEQVNQPPREPRVGMYITNFCKLHILLTFLLLLNLLSGCWQRRQPWCSS